MPEAKSQSNPKIGINMQSFEYITDRISYDIMMRLLGDDLIGPDDYVEIVMDDGSRAAVRRKDIVSIEKSTQEIPDVLFLYPFAR